MELYKWSENAGSLASELRECVSRVEAPILERRYNVSTEEGRQYTARTINGCLEYIKDFRNRLSETEIPDEEREMLEFMVQWREYNLRVYLSLAKRGKYPGEDAK